ncbi:MAG: hypothetical protein CMJ18_23685 [Phycisphaeraceae bacterium]|nr:hypothetical protein [Phycisphaeraceae bacterium]
MVTPGVRAQGTTLLGPSPYLAFDDSLPGAGAAISPFSTVDFGYFHLEDFEDALLNTPGVTADAGVAGSGSGFQDSVDADDGVINGTGRFLGSYGGFTGTTAMTFTFDASVLGALPTHVGIVWTDQGSAGSGGTFTANLSFEVFGSGGSSLGAIPPSPVGQPSDIGGTLEDRFFGAVNLEGIRSFRITTDSLGDWEMDHLQYGFVPEPGSAMLLLAAFVAVSRRR